MKNSPLRSSGQKNHSKHAAKHSARDVAFYILSKCLIERKELDGLFAGNSAFESLSDQDRGFCRQLVMTSLRYRGGLRYVYRKFLDRGIARKHAAAEVILIMASAQILFMNVPDYAAVNDAVTIAKKQKPFLPHKMINAVLKKIAKQKDELLLEVDFTAKALPKWLRTRLEADYGEKNTAEICKVVLQSPPTDISAKYEYDRSLSEEKKRSKLNELAEKLNATVLPTGSLRLPTGSGMVEKLYGFDDGIWWVQDAASAMPARILLEFLQNESSEGPSKAKILDICAAPGGKTAQLAAGGAQVTTLDRSENRLERLHENMQRLGLADEVEVVCADALEFSGSVGKSNDKSQKYDAILLDAPCSATGTLRRHPDIAWTKSADDIEELADLQAKILRHAFSLLKDGGMLLYCTCSLDKLEGEQQVESLLRDDEFAERSKDGGYEVQQVRITKNIAAKLGIHKSMVNKSGQLRVMPYHMSDAGGIDGFFAALLKKTVI